MMLAKFWTSGLILLLMLSGYASAQWPNLLMTNEQRKVIEGQRQQYLNPPPLTQAPASVAGDSILRKTLRVSAIIRQTEGMHLAQINGVMFKQGEQKNNIVVHHIEAQAVDLTINGKRGTARIGIEYNLTDWPKGPTAKITFSD